MAPRIPGLPVAFIAAGGVLVWSGIENQPVTAVLRSLARGQAPAKGAPETFATPGQSTLTAPGVPGGTATLGQGTGGAIAADALRYQGHPYQYGGAPGPAGANPWDCSSFANYVIGHDMGLAIPGFAAAGGYDGTGHGPPTGVWFVWTGCITVSSNPADAQPGDLAIWDIHHMGICLGPDQMISAQNPADGTRVSAIAGFTGGPFRIRRLKAVLSPATATIASAGPH